MKQSWSLLLCDFLDEHACDLLGNKDTDFEAVAAPPAARVTDPSDLAAFDLILDKLGVYQLDGAFRLTILTNTRPRILRHF